MPYLSLYRKYRSQSFEEVSGQDHVTRTLQNAIRADRVAHAYLFCGARGTGKTTTARLLAKCLNCEQGSTPEPCNACDNCRRIADGSSMDVIEIDAASNRGIDEIRALREKVQYAPSQSRKKVYVLDEVHMLTTEAFNALLKTLEEPPSHVVFILATTESHKVPATILSRCQRFDFRRGSVSQIGERLRYVAEQEGFALEPAAVARIARGAEGSWRDALSLLEQVLAYGEHTITLADVTEVLGTVDTDCLHALAEGVRVGDGAVLFGTIEELIAAGKDARQLTRDLVEYFRSLLRAAVGAAAADEQDVARLAAQASAFGLARLVRSLELLAQLEKDARWSDQARLALEVALVRLMRLVGEGAGAESAIGVARGSNLPARGSEPEQGGTLAPAPQAPSEPRSASREPRAASAASTSMEDVTAARVSEEGAAYGALSEMAGDADDTDVPLGEAAATPVEVGTTAVANGPVPATPVEAASVRDVPESSPAASGPDLATIQTRWRVVVEEIKRRKGVKTHALLVSGDARPARVEGQTLVVQFQVGTLLEMFQQGDNRQQLEAALQSVFGTGYRVALEQGRGDGDAGTPTPRRPDSPRGDSTGDRGGAVFTRQSEAPPAGGDTDAADRLIHDVIAIFNGKIIDG